jgi:hypothetical protein
MPKNKKGHPAAQAAFYSRENSSDGLPSKLSGKILLVGKLGCQEIFPE